MLKLILSACLLLAASCQTLVPTSSPGGKSILLHSYTSGKNSTSTALNNGEVFTGAWERVDGYQSIVVRVATDQTGTYQLQFSPDQVNLDGSLPPYTISGTSPYIPHRVTPSSTWYRLVITNDSGSNQTFLRATSLIGSYHNLTSALNGSLAQDFDSMVVRQVPPEFEIASDKFSGWRVVNKFGRNSDVDAAGEDIWEGGGAYTGFPAGSAETFTITSSSDEDTLTSGTGAWTLRLYYMDSDKNAFDSAGDFLFEDVNMAGTSGVTTTATGLRVWRAQVLTSGSGGTNAGIITINHTTTTANVFASIAVARGQTSITSFTIPSGYTGFMKRYRGGILDNNANDAELSIWTRPENQSAKLIRPFVVNTAYDTADKVPYGGLVFTEKTDLVFRATEISNANGIITVEWDMVLIKN